MQQSVTKSLSLSLDDHISLWRTRHETLVWLVTLIIQTGTVSLWRLAGHGDTRAKTLSVHRRFERFFQHVHLPDKSHGRLQRSLFALGLNAFRKAMVKMTGPEIVGYMTELFKPKF